ncbi:TIGR04283 family arsenosugar biosynthesis glycosyltransferase [Actinomycetospora sp. TBRC 11914]|uniref:TIGR04283 family arsenosugar biosynthesis glycosyltransferase n=1 Tax=Actinomycetospora sp. TBRC 11914 TaxID=2729387 RepID=UPI00145EC1D4|nr:TIGR04283 family arsenosugar biosynthesis glycosyltransferase [Actinomycetospora sp. TBRC 11914]NMO92256.1 glycosyltransferase family 2 protein [Actinomycetospora sp. TBRC 11914]
MPDGTNDSFVASTRTNGSFVPRADASADQLAVSIIVPVRDEETRIAATLRSLRAAFGDCELIVVDGGSRDATVARAAPHATVLHADGGRGPQLNAGAAAAHGEVLWFVHADARPDPGALPALRAALADPRVVGGGCRLRFDRTGPVLRWLVWTSNLRARHLHWIFGDQAVFVRRSAFDDVGGFPAIPIMEDLEMSRRLARRGRLVVLPTPCTASARRLVERGPARMLVLMQLYKLQYFLGVDPSVIRRRYETSRR